MFRPFAHSFAALLVLAPISFTSFRVAASDDGELGATARIATRVERRPVETSGAGVPRPEPTAIVLPELRIAPPRSLSRPQASLRHPTSAPQPTEPARATSQEPHAERDATPIVPLETFDEHGWHTPQNPFVRAPREVQSAAKRVDLLPHTATGAASTNGDDEVLRGFHRLVARGLSVDLSRPTPDDGAQTTVVARASLWPVTVNIVGKFE
jgi:hypothetical protein